MNCRRLIYYLVCDSDNSVNHKKQNGNFAKGEEWKEDKKNNAGEKANFMASNVLNSRSFEIKAPDVVIKVSPDRTDLVETRQIDGRTFLMIELTDNVEVNGMVVKPL